MAFGTLSWRRSPQRMTAPMQRNMTFVICHETMKNVTMPREGPKRRRYTNNCLSAATRSETSSDICHLPTQTSTSPLDTYTAYNSMALLLSDEAGRQPFIFLPPTRCTSHCLPAC